MDSAIGPFEERVLIFAPKGRDAALIAKTLCGNGIDAAPATDMTSLCHQIELGAGAVIITEEALTGSGIALLTRTLSLQSPWSDLPIIVLTTGGQSGSGGSWHLVRRLEPVGNVSLLERPLRSMTLVSAAQVALRSRRRQYEVRSLHQSLERRVKQRTEELERLNLEAEGFNYSISHDLRTPLRAISSTSSMLLQDYERALPQKAAFLLQRQAQAATKLADLIDDLLRLSRLSRQEMRPHRFDFSALAHDVVAEIESRGMTNACEFRIEEGLFAHGDAVLIRFVLLNLIENACKFSPNGGDVAVGKGDKGAFVVKDKGIGFDMQFAHKLFLPFERLVKDDDFPGTGIGLANVKRIVERHGGTIWAESELGCGATFFFTLQE